jgi:hypothetical protein
MITLALTERGSIWGWGNGETHQLGPAGGASKIVWAPVPLDFPVPQSFPSSKALETKKENKDGTATSAAVVASSSAAMTSSSTSSTTTMPSATSTTSPSSSSSSSSTSAAVVASSGDGMTIEDMDPPASTLTSIGEMSPGGAKLASGGRTAAAKASPKIILRPKVGGSAAKKPVPPPLRRGTTATKLQGSPAPVKRSKTGTGGNDDEPKVVFTDISSAAIDCAALTHDGLVYVWGWNFHEDSGLPQLIGALRDDGVKIANISMGKSTLLLST